MPDIRFITGGELETVSHHMWTSTGSGAVPVSGVPGAHGKVYDNSGLPPTVAFPATPIVTTKFRFRFGASVDSEPIMSLHDGVSTQILLNYRSSGAVEVASSSVLATSAGGLFVIDTWYDVELVTRISNGAGSVAVNRNGSQIICVPSGLDTQVTGNAQVNRWAIANNSLDSFYDNCVLDRSGAYLGTGEVETLMPSAAGDVTELSPSSIGVGNHTLVDEKPHDSDTTYVFSTADQIDTYQFEDISLSGMPLAAMLAVKARHTTGSPTLKLICRIDGDNYESAAFGTLSSYGEHFFHCWSVNPATGAAWTVESFNAAQWGVHCLATGIRVTQVGLQVYMKSAESAQCIGSGAARDYCASVSEDLN